jgi:hypothetical protein
MPFIAQSIALHLEVVPESFEFLDCCKRVHRTPPANSLASSSSPGARAFSALSTT